MANEEQTERLWSPIAVGEEREVHDDTKTGRQLINTLIRWQVSGGVWRVSHRSPAMITVALLRCDAGEVVDQISSGDTEWLRYLQDRGSSDPY